MAWTLCNILQGWNGGSGEKCTLFCNFVGRKLAILGANKNHSTPNLVHQCWPFIVLCFSTLVLLLVFKDFPLMQIKCQMLSSPPKHRYQCKTSTLCRLPCAFSIKEELKNIHQVNLKVTIVKPWSISHNVPKLLNTNFVFYMQMFPTAKYHLFKLEEYREVFLLRVCGACTSLSYHIFEICGEGNIYCIWPTNS